MVNWSFAIFIFATLNIKCIYNNSNNNTYIPNMEAIWVVNVLYALTHQPHILLRRKIDMECIYWGYISDTMSSEWSLNVSYNDDENSQLLLINYNETWMQVHGVPQNGNHSHFQSYTSFWFSEPLKLNIKSSQMSFICYLKWASNPKIIGPIKSNGTKIITIKRLRLNGWTTNIETKKHFAIKMGDTFCASSRASYKRKLKDCFEI